ncbi:MAG: DUF2125 domain-containing protein [Pseudomonadota bacterium]|nr:DUF2125 domain-containing protein [Pseudomonadota bacterium]
MILRKSAIVISVIALAMAYIGYWFYARTVVLQVINDWTEQRRAEGFTVSYDGPDFGGFPLLVRAVLKNPQLQRNAFAWRGERMQIELQPWNFQRIRIDLEGKQRVTLKEGAAQMTLVPTEAAIVAKLSEVGRFADATLLVHDLTLSNPAEQSLLQVAEIWLKATAPTTSPASHQDVSLGLSLSAADILLPRGLDGPLGRKISKIRADLQVRGSVPSGSREEALEAWRRSGGTVDVNWLQINWAKFDLRAKGTIALDNKVRPIGAFSTDIRGHNQALDALVAHAVLEPATATMAKIGLTLLAKSPPEGGAPVLTLPVTAQDGHLYAGPLKILDLDPIRLPTSR